MEVLLVDVDSKYPNLALMQLSAYHKSLGDTVGFDTADPDKVYVSCVFTRNRGKALGIQTLYPDAVVDIGGSGISLDKKIPAEAQKMYPDYSLYPVDYSYGFTTRGCVRHCPFCVVPEKEGTIQKWNHVSEFYNPEFKKVRLLDNNMYAIPDWFFENTDFILEHNLSLRVVQGFDIRLLSDEIAERLALLNFEHGLSFAFDNIKDEQAVIKGIDMLLQAGIKPYKLSFFVLTGYNSTLAEDLYRIDLLMQRGVNPFVMQYRKTQVSNMLARWCNRRWISHSVSFTEYKPYVDYLRKNNLENVEEVF